jgi:predicted kinase
VKKAWIYCGVSGAGKTTYIDKAHSGAPVCSADRLTGLYPSPGVIDASKLGEAHAFCLRDFNRLVLNAAPEIVVDNTNTTIAELAPYVALAQAYGYEVQIVTLWCDPGIAHARNGHGTPLSVVQAMHERLKAREMPPWWSHSDVPQMDGGS